MKIDKKLFLIFVIFFASVFFVKDNKTYLLSYFIASFLLFLNGRSLKEILFSNLLLSLIFERGLRGWMISVVPDFYDYNSGYVFYFGLSIKFILAAIIFFAYFKDVVWSEKNLKKSKIILLSFLVLSIFSTLMHDLDHILILGLFRVIYVVAIFFIFADFLKEEKFKKIFFNVAVCWLLFSGIIGTIQFLKQGLIGTYFEESTSIARFGYTTNESDFLFRVSGFTGHPTFFGSWLVILLALIIAYYVKDSNEEIFTKKLIMISSIVSLIAIFATYSRSAWLSLLIIISAFAYYFYKKGALRLVLKKAKFLIFFGLVILIFNGGFLLERIESFNNIWTIGSGRGRIQLIDESIYMIKNNIFFGVGLNKFTSEMVQNNVSDAAKYFLYPVHNTFLLFASELGLLSFFVFVYFVFHVLSKYYRVNKTPEALLLLTPAFVFIFNAQFHTLFSQDPSFDLFIIILAFMDANS